MPPDIAKCPVGGPHPLIITDLESPLFHWQQRWGGCLSSRLQIWYVKGNAKSWPLYTLNNPLIIGYWIIGNWQPEETGLQFRRKHIEFLKRKPTLQAVGAPGLYQPRLLYCKPSSFSWWQNRLLSESRWGLSLGLSLFWVERLWLWIFPGLPCCWVPSCFGYF